jgi:hypothetical protein
MSSDNADIAVAEGGAQPELLEMAEAGDKLDEAALAPLRSYLNEQIEALNGELVNATSQDVIDRILAEQNRLAAKANALTALSIMLAAGEAKISTIHIRSAVDAARKVIDKIAEITKRLEKIGAVIDFAAAVLTGNGRVIVEGAEALKTALKQTD